MTVLHEFGGEWTEEKLRRLEKYLRAYMRIFSTNPYAKRYIPNYVDAFAGTGSRTRDDRAEGETLALFDADDQTDLQVFYRGSAQRALLLDPPFGHYLFIERKPEYVGELARLRNDFPQLASRIEIRQGDANNALQAWCRETDWHTNRAVVFLDPYGMAVDWQTIRVIAGTKAIDLWVLLPVGAAINRLLLRKGPPSGGWAESLTRLFGTEEWRDAFYRPSLQPSLLGDIDPGFAKTASFRHIGEFFVERLKREFPVVPDEFLMLFNSKRNPIFMLFFAAANVTAAKIAGDILRK